LQRYFSFIVAKPEAKVHACSILLRGPSKDVMNEVERNLNDAMFVARNVMRESRLVCGGGENDFGEFVFL
jgi:T-complex protein 1 subunit gamma